MLAVEGRDADEMLALAADLESHFPHSLANAVVEAAKKKGLSYGKPHSKPEYIVAHGIVTNTKEGRVLIGSYHFVFEDEGVEIVGCSSDHTIVDVTDTGREWKSGDTLTFKVRYANMLYAFTGDHLNVEYHYDA